MFGNIQPASGGLFTNTQGLFPGIPNTSLFTAPPATNPFLQGQTAPVQTSPNNPFTNQQGTLGNPNMLFGTPNRGKKALDNDGDQDLFNMNSAKNGSSKKR